jgi:hypothetical protein
VSELIKPKHKGKQDGVVDYLTSEEERMLVMRGDYTEADVIQAAVHQNIIDADDAEQWLVGINPFVRIYQSWFKASPISGGSWHYGRDTPCRGAYFATVICKG